MIRVAVPDTTVETMYRLKRLLMPEGRWDLSNLSSRYLAPGETPEYYMVRERLVEVGSDEGVFAQWARIMGARVIEVREVNE